MPRRIVIGALATTLLVASLAACGGPSATPSASASAPASTEPASEPPTATDSPSTEPDATATPASSVVRMLALCDGVAIRKGTTTTDEILVRVPKLTKVRVVETVAGDDYEVGTCGTSGSDWVKISRINGKTVKSLYGVQYGYAAAGFFE